MGIRAFLCDPHHLPEHLPCKGVILIYSTELKKGGHNSHVLLDNAYFKVSELETNAARLRVPDLLFMNYWACFG